MHPILRIVFVAGLLLVNACDASKTAATKAETQAPKVSTQSPEQPPPEQQSPIASSETPDSQAHQRFDACTATSECIVLPAVCGDPQGVNRAHRKDFDAQVAAQAPLVDCATPKPNPPRHIAQCVEGRCVAVPERKAP